jgi:hypothetical protein
MITRRPDISVETPTQLNACSLRDHQPSLHYGSAGEQEQDHEQEAAEPRGARLLPAVPELCTDNAAMIAFAASLSCEGGL